MLFSQPTCHQNLSPLNFQSAPKFISRINGTEPVSLCTNMQTMKGMSLLVVNLEHIPFSKTWTNSIVCWVVLKKLWSSPKVLSHSLFTDFTFAIFFHCVEKLNSLKRWRDSRRYNKQQTHVREFTWESPRTFGICHMKEQWENVLLRNRRKNLSNDTKKLIIRIPSCNPLRLKCVVVHCLTSWNTISKSMPSLSSSPSSMALLYPTNSISSLRRPQLPHHVCHRHLVILLRSFRVFTDCLSLYMFRRESKRSVWRYWTDSYRPKESSSNLWRFQTSCI
jgi:hypothetical protein